MMYLLFNEYGAIKDKQINEWIVQGSNNVNKIGVAIDGVDSTSFALVGVCKLPNGEVVTTAPVDEQAEIINGVYGVVFSLSKDITALEGTLRINIQAINTTTDKIITSYTVYLCVNEGVDPGEIVMMTADQYQDLLSKIELDVQNDETILTFGALPLASNYSVGQVIYVRNSSVKKLYECVSNNDTLEWHETFDFNNHYTKGEVDTFLNAKQDKLTVESLDTAQLQYSVGFDANGNLKKGAGGGGGGAIYTAGYGISINDLTDEISVDTDEIATHTFVTQAIETVKKNAFIAVDTTDYPTLADFLDSDGEEGYVYLYPVDTTDLTKGYKQYIWEVDDQDVGDWIYLGDTTLDLSPYARLDAENVFTQANTFSNTVSFANKKVMNIGNYNFYVNDNNIFLRHTNDGQKQLFTSSGSGSGTTFTFMLNSNGYGLTLPDTTSFTANKEIATTDNPGLFNVINASDIVNNTLTQAQYDLITNGKPTLIKGNLLNYQNLFILPFRTNIGGGVVSRARFIAYASAGNAKDGVIQINNGTLGITIYTGATVDLDAIASINGKDINYYLNNVYPYATNSTTTLQYEKINNISISADTTYTLATAPNGTYPEYKANITNSGASAINLTFTGVSVIKTNDSNITIASNVLTLPAGTTIEVSIVNGKMIAFNWSAN